MKKRNLYSILIFLLVFINQFTLKAQWLGNQNASNVVGASNFTSQGSLTSVKAYAVSPTTGKIFIALGETVYRYGNSAKESNGAAPEQILSGAGLTVRLDQIFDLVIDESDNLWIVDTSNNRVLKYAKASIITDLNSPNLVLGQNNFDTRGTGTDMDQFYAPLGIALRGNFLYVSDGSNHRVLRFDDINNLTKGASASVVLGTVGGASITASTFNRPYKLFVDRDDHLWVADGLNNRVLKFNQASTLTSGAAASLVLGQPNFTSNTASTTANGLNFPPAVVVDGLRNVYVADNKNNRVLVYHSPSVNGATATVVLGQGDFTSKTAGPLSEKSIQTPFGLYVADNYLAVAAVNDARVMLFTSSTNLPIQLTSFSAKHASNSRINFTWETSSETDNDYFEIHLSKDGKVFDKVATIQSKHATGNATSATQYTHTFHVDDLLVASFGLLSLLLLPNLRKRWIQLAVVVMVVGNFVACEKDKDTTDKADYKYAKLVQVDKDGTREDVQVITIK